MKNTISTYCAVKSDNYGVRATAEQRVGRTSSTYIRVLSGKYPAILNISRIGRVAL